MICADDNCGFATSHGFMHWHRLRLLWLCLLLIVSVDIWSSLLNRKHLLNHHSQSYPFWRHYATFGAIIIVVCFCSFWLHRADRLSQTIRSHKLHIHTFICFWWHICGWRLVLMKKQKRHWQQVPLPSVTAVTNKQNKKHTQQESEVVRQTQTRRLCH